MTKIDLFESATQNLNLYNKEEEHKITYPSVLTFVNDKSNISINLNDFALFSFLKAGEYININQLYEDEKKPKEYKLKSYFKPRSVFENHFNLGDLFKYAALNLGTMGLSKFGKYCLVFSINNSNFSKNNSCFLKHDSLLKQNGNFYYFKDEDTLDLDLILSDLAALFSFNILVIEKHKTELNKIKSKDLPTLICNSKDNTYIEFITTGMILRDNLVSLRINESDYNSYLDEIVEAYSENEGFSKIDESLLIINMIFDLIKEHKINTEVLYA